MTEIIQASTDNGTKNRTVYQYSDSNSSVAQPLTVTRLGDQSAYNDQALRSQTIYDVLGRAKEKRMLASATCQPTTPSCQVSVVKTEYDGRGRVLRTSNGSPASNPVWTTFGYDTLGRVTSVTGPLGTTTTSYRLDEATTTGATNGSTVNGQAGQVKNRQRVDGAGRLTRVVETLDTTDLETTYGYDAADRLKTVTQSPQSRAFYYDLAGRLRGVIQPEVAATVAFVDEVGAAVNVSMVYGYDDAGNLTSRTDPRSTMSYQYDAADRRTTASGVLVDALYCYDGKTVSADGTACAGSAVNLSRGKLSEAAVRYDGGRANVVKYTYDALGRPATSSQVQKPSGETADITLSFGYTYFRNGTLNTITYPSGRAITYNYDTGDRLSSLTGAKEGQSGRTYANGITIDHAGRITNMAYQLTKGGANVRERWCFDSLRDLPSGVAVGTANITTCGNTSGDEMNLGWTWYANGNLSSQYSAQMNVTQTYTYDTLDRLATAQETGSPGWSQSYGYDRFGNRWVPSTVGVTYRDPLTPTSNVFDGGTNRIIGTNLYDGSGNQTFVAPYNLVYDGENRVRSYSSAVNGAGSYRYDANGRRVEATVSGTAKLFVYDAFGNLAAEYDKASGGVSDSRVRYVVPDYLGSTRMTLGASATGLDVRRFDYLPFGEDLASAARTGVAGFGAAGVPVKFTGKERDAETGLDYFGARYYSSAQGRFVSPDVAGADLSNPQSFNKYRYALNNALRHVDPSGHYEEDVHYHLTDVLARAAGFSSEIARRIARSNQDSDDDPRKSPMVMRPWGEPKRVRAAYHFTTPERRLAMRQAFYADGSPESLGTFLHALQDSYSHAGYGPTLGQIPYAWEGLFSDGWRDAHEPDWPFMDPQKADRMAKDTFEELQAASYIMGAGRPLLSWKQLSGPVGRFNRAHTIEAKREAIREIYRLLFRELLARSEETRRLEEERRRAEEK